MRIRTVKPEFWSHPVLSRQEDGTRMLAIALLNIADDEGFFHADPALIRSAVWPFDEDSTKARRALESLSKIGWIELTEHPTHGMIGRVVNFTKHQRVDRPSDSKIKVYFDSANIRRGLDDQSPLEQGTGSREQGTGNGEGADAPPAQADPNPPPKKKPEKRASHLPADFYPNETGVEYANKRGVNLSIELESFRNRHIAKGSTMKDWQAAWRSWCDKAVEFGRAGKAQAGGRDESRRRAYQELTGKNTDGNDTGNIIDLQPSAVAVG